MALNTLKCNHLTTLGLKGLNHVAIGQEPQLIDHKLLQLYYKMTLSISYHRYDIYHENTFVMRCVP